MDIDSVDRSILAVLQDEGRITNAELAGRVGLSPSACHRRLRQLEAGGVIAGYSARVDRDALGRGVSVFVEVSLESQREDVLDAFEAQIRGVPGVMSCHLMAGDADYLIHVTCRDVADYEAIHREHIAVLPGVTRLRSSFAIRTVTDSSTLPVR